MYSRASLEGLRLDQVKRVAKDFDIDTSKTKDSLINAILGLQELHIADTDMEWCSNCDSGFLVPKGTKCQECINDELKVQVPSIHLPANVQKMIDDKDIKSLMEQGFPDLCEMVIEAHKTNILIKVTTDEGSNIFNEYGIVNYVKYLQESGYVSRTTVINSRVALELIEEASNNGYQFDVEISFNGQIAGD